MREIADLLFQARILKELPRSGYHFLGAGQESVAEHCFCTTFIAYVMAQLETDIDPLRLISMCLVHDLVEARTGDLNTVHKMYVSPNHDLALNDTVKDFTFGQSLAGLIHKFEEGKTTEALLARDADQLAFVIDLKSLADTGYRTPKKWLPPILKRLKTETGRKIAHSIMDTEWDNWWLKNYIDTPNHNH